MKVCLLTYIYGDKYQNYIPLVLYSIAKSYPDFYVKFFISGNLNKSLIPSLELVNQIYHNYKIIEHTFDDCKNMTPLKAKSLRWVLWDDDFMEFDYLYYIDSDILFVKEPLSLVEQHIRHMEYIGSDCVSNILRKKYLSNSDFNLYYSAIKFAGFKGLIQYPFTKYVYRMSGLHFVKVSTYFKYLTKDIIQEYRNKILSGKAFKEILYPNDEALLYHIMKKAGCDMSVFGIQTSSSSMFGVFEAMKKVYCPHHGIHMGIFRIKLFDQIEWTVEQLNSNDYLYYVKYILENWFTDDLFLNIYKLLPETIKEDFKKFCDYYRINFSLL